MDKMILQQLIDSMPDHIRVKVNRVARDLEIDFADAVLFLVQKGINALPVESVPDAGSLF